MKKPMTGLTAPLLFGTSLGPLVSFFSFSPSDTHMPMPIGVCVGWLAGTATGFFACALMEHMLALHRGFTLYNVSCRNDPFSFACSLRDLEPTDVIEMTD